MKMYPSDPLFADVWQIVNGIAALTNAHVHHDLREMPEAERLAELDRLKGLLVELGR
jgi:hypothetical protein